MKRIKLSEYTSKRDAIIRAASELFVYRGYDGASMEAIADAASVSRQTIYNQFESKEALFGAIVDDLVDELLAPLATSTRGSSIRQTLMAFAEHILEMMVRPKLVALHRLALTETGRFPDFGRAIYQAGALRCQETLADYLRDQAREGKLELPDPLVAAGHFLALTTRETEIKTLFGVESRLSSEEIHQRAKTGVGVFLKAYGGSGVALTPSVAKIHRRPLRQA